MDLPFRASAAAARGRGGLLMATDAGLAAFRPASRAVEVLAPLSLREGFRTNDGKVDPFGRFWWSTMDDDGGRRPGAIYVTEPDLSTRQVLEGISIANAMAFSAEGDRFYLADSAIGTLFEYQTGDLKRRRVFARTCGGGAPDGAAMDAIGGLWNAEWGAGRVVRYGPDGAIDRVVTLPVPQPTSCAFGGPDLATLYITTAWDGLSDAERAERPLSGALFALEPGICGLHVPAFAG